MYPQDRESVLWWLRMSYPKIEVVVEQIPDGEFQIVVTDVTAGETVHFLPLQQDLHEAMLTGIRIASGAFDDLEQQHREEIKPPDA